MKILKPKFWNKKNNLISFFLLPVSVFLQILIILKNKISKKKNFSIPIICVGNIYLGGTGKTPLSIKIVKILKRLNKKTAIIKKLHTKHSDEFKLIESKQIKLFTSHSRSRAIDEAIKNGFECVVLDDGYQDFSVNKNLNILCFNEKQLVGNGMTLPSGPIRESFSSLERCQIVIINGNVNLEFEKKIKNISKNIRIFYSKYLPTNVKKFENQNLLAFAGIGNPENFFSLMEKNNLILKKKIAFPDHYDYSIKELNKLINFSLKNNLKLVTTEKDYFRIKHHKLRQIDFLNIDLEIINNNKFEEEIIKYI